MIENSKSKTYKVVKIDKNSIIINGQANHSLWEKANLLTDFSSPWDDKPSSKITFKALWDETNLYCSFKVDDDSIHINENKDRLSSINNSDRVELFFRQNEQLDPYYCLEIDPNTRLMNFKAKPNKEFDFNWNWSKKDILIKSDIQKNYFTVEVVISLDSLKQLGLLTNNTIETGIYRAKYHKQNDGSFEPTWITWINPNTDSPNFHIASSFGVFHLV